MIRVLLADDHPVVRAGLRALIATAPDLLVVGDVGTAEEAVAGSDALGPDVVLMDLRFGEDRDGVAATRRIRDLPTPPAVLVLTTYGTDGDILGAVEAGASGYLLKDAPPEELLAAVRAAAAGESALAPSVAGRLLARVRDPAPRLSERELEVLHRVAAGDSNGQTARRLHVTEATVKTHLVHVFTKLDVASRTAAVARARELGLLG